MTVAKIEIQYLFSTLVTQTPVSFALGNLRDIHDKRVAYAA
jgi:hypothetical protein